MVTTEKHKSKLWYICNTKLLSGLDDKDREELLSKLKEREINRKNFVYTSGDPAENIYILKEGKIKITRLTEEGKELTLDILAPGDLFGELALGGEQERETSAEAMEDCFICVIRRSDFEDFLSERPNLSLAITKWMGSRLRRIENRFEDMLFQDVRTRLLSTLRDLAEKYGVQVPEGRKIAIKLSHQEIANLVGATRETVTLEINNLKKDGDILMDKREIIIPAKSLP